MSDLGAFERAFSNWHELEGYIRHSPEPWELRLGAAPDGEGLEVTLEIADANGEPVAHLARTACDPGNANVIAATPQLLWNLRLAVAWLQTLRRQIGPHALEDARPEMANLTAMERLADQAASDLLPWDD